MGRPSSYMPEYDEQAEKLCKLGATDAELADFFDVSEVTLNAWKKEFPTFLKSLKAGKLQADANIGEKLYQRAQGYSHPDVHISNYQGAISITPIVKHYPPDTTAAIFWLKNRRPEQWRDKTEREITIKKSAEEMSDDELNRIAAASSPRTPEKAGGKKKPAELH
jgi:hypothetical protein